MKMEAQTITREQVVALAMSLPLDKLESWYTYGLFIQSYPAFTQAFAPMKNMEGDLEAEMAVWEAASDEDFLKFEDHMREAV